MYTHKHAQTHTHVHTRTFVSSQIQFIFFQRNKEKNVLGSFAVRARTREHFLTGLRK